MHIFLSMTVIEQLFSTKARIRLLRLALFHSDEDFTAEELKKRLGSGFNSRQAKDFVKVGCFTVGVRQSGGETTYRIDPNWLLFPELRALFMKAQLLVEHDLVRRLQAAGRLQILILTGIFIGEPRGLTDVLVVGALNRERAARLFRCFEKDLNQEVHYTIMTPLEYRYRKDIGDRFLYDILEQKYLVVVDTMAGREEKKNSSKRNK